MIFGEKGGEKEGEKMKSQKTQSKHTVKKDSQNQR
jgi:hypothetical protein